VIRHAVTEYTPAPPNSAGMGSQVVGEFPNEQMAEKVREALEFQAAPRAFVAVLSTFEPETRAMYFQSEEDAEKFRRGEDRTWRIFSQVVPPQH